MAPRTRNIGTWIAGGALALTLLGMLIHGSGRAAVITDRVELLDTRVAKVEADFQKHGSDETNKMRLIVRDEAKGREKELDQLEKLVRANHDALLTMKADLHYIKKHFDSK